MHALSAHRNTKLLLEQCLRFTPRYAVISEIESADEMAALLRASDCQTELLVGETGLLEVASAPETDVVMAAIVGGAGLASSLAAVQHGKRLLLANKEALVMSGELFMQTAAESGSQIIPIDSEHNAIFQCLPLNLAGVHADQLSQVEKIVLTSSGGPFLNSPARDLTEVTPEQACKHPELVHGPEDIRGFGDDDEQGAGIY